jgi:hypothetical protein
MDEPPLFALAKRVANAAKDLQIETALIGASALAVHNYVRATEDVDLATAVDPYTKLSGLQAALSKQGIKTKLLLPDEDDVLGGVLKAWEVEDEEGDPIDVVEVVNFYNPHRPGRKNPGAAAIKNSAHLEGPTSLRCVQLADLIALKLFAGSRKDLGDIAELLVANAAVDLAKVRETAKPYDRNDELEKIFEEVKLRVSRHR